jgi:hypothetical protein
MSHERDRPVRHAASSRNRRKIMHFAKNLRDEIAFLRRQSVNLRYMQDRIEKLINRLRAER